ncbi:MAG: alpha/beta hydrolase [Actinomycetota bacterium]
MGRATSTTKISKRARLARRSLGQFVEDPDVPIEKRRELMERIDKAPRPRKVDYVDTTVGGVPSIVATPTGVPVEREVMYIHGGGYVVGSPKSHIAMCARLARLARARTTVIDYRLAPEHPYPAAIDDCLSAYRSIIADTDPSLVTIAGDSAGGGATLATLCALRDADVPLPGAGYVISPWTDLTASGETVQTRAASDPLIDAGWLSDIATQYAVDVPLDHPAVSPLFADLSGLPPLLVQTASEEVLLSDSTRLVERARDAGVSVDFDVRDGMWHVYQIFAGMVPEADDALIEAAAFIRAKTPVPVSTG